MGLVEPDLPVQLGVTLQVKGSHDLQVQSEELEKSCCRHCDMRPMAQWEAQSLYLHEAR